MGLFDFLTYDPDPKKGIMGKPVQFPLADGEDARSKLDKLAGVKAATNMTCGICGHGGHGRECKCDPKLGRPRKWWE